MTEPAMTKPRRRWFSISLRGLMVLVLVIGGVLGWKARRASIQRQAVAAIKSVGGTVEYDYYDQARRAAGKWMTTPPHPWAPDWLRRPIGDEYFQDVAWVLLGSTNLKAEIKYDPGVTEAVAKLDRVERLLAYNYPLDDTDFARLMAMPRLKNANMFGINVTDDGLRCLESSPAIESLALRSKPGTITARGLEWMARQPRIKRLELTQVDLDDPKSLAPLAKLTRLEYLLLMYSPEDDSCLASLQDLTDLVTLNLKQTRLTDGGIDSLKKLNKLEKLFVDGSLLTDAGLARLAAIPSLKSLYLDPLPKLGELGISSLDKLAGSDTLCLHASNVTDAGIGHLKVLKALRMSLSGSGVTDFGLANLVLTNQLQVQELDLSRTSITGEGVGALANQTGLRSLALNGSKVDDTGAAEFAKLTELGYLSLDETSITDAGLTKLRQVPKLQVLKIRGTKVTPEGVAAFQEARPDVSVDARPAEKIPGGP